MSTDAYAGPAYRLAFLSSGAGRISATGDKTGMHSGESKDGFQWHRIHCIRELK
jgi:hypothetical protein